MKICLFLFSFALYFTINALFYGDSKIHKIYVDKGMIDFITHIPHIIYSTFISTVIFSLLKYFSLSEKNVLKLKSEKNVDKCTVDKLYKFFIIKFTLFFIFSTFFLLLFWYYLSCFCIVYYNTQYILLKDTLISFGSSLLYPFGLTLLPGILRIISLRKGNKECLYNLSVKIYILI